MKQKNQIYLYNEYISKFKTSMRSRIIFKLYFQISIFAFLQFYQYETQLACYKKKPRVTSPEKSSVFLYPYVHFLYIYPSKELCMILLILNLIIKNFEILPITQQITEKQLELLPLKCHLYVFSLSSFTLPLNPFKEQCMILLILKLII